MADMLRLLQSMGFGDYEARAYAALLARSPLQEDDLARVAGLPRAHVGVVLDKLEERGALARVGPEAGPRYAAVPPADLPGLIGRRSARCLRAAQGVLQDMEAPPAYEYVWTARGYPALLDHARILIDSAQTRLEGAIGPREAIALADSLAAAEARGVQVIMLREQPRAGEWDGGPGDLPDYGPAPGSAGRWLALVQDGIEALAGQIGEGDEARTVRTREPVLVELSAGYIRQRIALAGVAQDLGSALPDLVAPPTAASLASLGLRGYPQAAGGEIGGQGAGVGPSHRPEAGWPEYVEEAFSWR